MDRERCPNCGFSFGWDGSYCSHCRRGLPDRDRWAGYTAVADFPLGIGTPRQRMLFGLACLRQVVRLADKPLRQLFEMVESLAGGGTEFAAFRRAAVPIWMSWEGSLHDSDGRSDRNDRQATSSRAVVEFTQGIGPEGWESERFDNLVTRAREAAIIATHPVQELRTGPLPDHLEPLRERALAWYRGTRIEDLVSDDDAAAYPPVLAALNSAHQQSFDAHLRAARAEEAVQCNLLRDIIPYPGDDDNWLPAWRTPTVRALAEGIHATGNFGVLSILADALEEAGCDDEHLLAHCREPGEHVRGCWVVEWALGRTGEPTSGR